MPALAIHALCGVAFALSSKIILRLLLKRADRRNRFAECVLLRRAME
jgi:hypothetical protein